MVLERSIRVQGLRFRRPRSGVFQGRGFRGSGFKVSGSEFRV